MINIVNNLKHICVQLLLNLNVNNILINNCLFNNLSNNKKGYAKHTLNK